MLDKVDTQSSFVVMVDMLLTRSVIALASFCKDYGLDDSDREILDEYRALCVSKGVDVPGLILDTLADSFESVDEEVILEHEYRTDIVRANATMTATIASPSSDGPELSDLIMSLVDFGGWSVTEVVDVSLNLDWIDSDSKKKGILNSLIGSRRSDLEGMVSVSFSASLEKEVEIMGMSQSEFSSKVGEFISSVPKLEGDETFMVKSFEIYLDDDDVYLKPVL